MLTTELPGSRIGFPAPFFKATAPATVLLPAVPGATPATLTVLNALGHPLCTQTAATNSTTRLDLTGLAPGLYAVRVAAGSSAATHRLVVE
ncbi:T9SS type A sorting domain-containing protein [Hymenobacter terricola]|uniref:T9SS type A sorting domain-containing protein n=1 Tax=Hymenobacter terricola TaxID=2819236 RepID=UPI001B30414B|nr:T9SS type A sorting domain-containing protein [Hymenobacter terricola]